jgi:hypothetical protein
MHELEKALQCYETASNLDPQLTEASKAAKFIRQTIGPAATTTDGVGDAAAR